MLIRKNFGAVRLPPPLVVLWEWQLRAKCATAATSIFFPAQEARGKRRQTLEANAKSICQDCGVQPECLAHAIECREPYGIWGGLTVAERAEIVSTTVESKANRVADQRHTIGPPKRTYIKRPRDAITTSSEARDH